MNVFDIIGYIGMAIILYSFTITDMYKLRLINSIGCVFWIIYGLGIMAGPTILVNSCVLVIHSYWFYANRKGQGVGGESLKEKFIDSSVSTNVNSDSSKGNWDDNKVHTEQDFMYK